MVSWSDKWLLDISYLVYFLYISLPWKIDRIFPNEDYFSTKQSQMPNANKKSACFQAQTFPCARSCPHRVLLVTTFDQFFFIFPFLVH